MSSYEEYAQLFEGLAVEERLALFRSITSKGVKVLGDGREECVYKFKSGKREYKHRTLFVYEVYGRKCKLCGYGLSEANLTADHIIPRGNGGGWRDDRVTNLWPAHSACNVRRGSRRIADGESCEFCGHDVVIKSGDDRECFRCNCRS